MSTTVTKGAAAAPAAAQPKAPIPAVSLLNHAVAGPAAIAHPLILAGLFVWRFDALVADPKSTLQYSLPVVALVQIAYAMLCFPPAGSQAAKAARRQKKDAIVPNSIATAILSMILTALTVPAFHVLFVLFGAPFLTNALDTLLCCAHFAVLAIFPVVFVRGSDTHALRAVLGVSAPLDQTFGGLAGATIGAWLGAVPIPLDWDREWQKWPVTIVVGIYLGYIVGSKFLGTVFHGKRWAEGPSPKED